MNRFATGFIIGNIIGMTSMLLKDTKTNRKAFVKGTKQAIDKVGDIVEDLVDMYK